MRRRGRGERAKSKEYADMPYRYKKEKRGRRGGEERKKRKKTESNRIIPYHTRRDHT